MKLPALCSGFQGEEEGVIEQAAISHCIQMPLSFALNRASICEVRAGQYWRLEKLKSFDEFLARRFPESRRKAYYLMSIDEHLPPQARKELKEVGWTKGLELAKVARRDGQEFDCATWLHKARALPKDQFKQEVEKELTGRDSEPWEIVYLKLYRTQILVQRGLEMAGLMPGVPDSRDARSRDLFWVWR